MKKTADFMQSVPGNTFLQVNSFNHHKSITGKM